MSRCSDGKRLAVLQSVIDDGLSIREAASLHGVNKNSVMTWLQGHHNGKLAIAKLLAQGVVPVLVGVDKTPSDDVDAWVKCGTALRARLEKERDQLKARLSVVENELTKMCCKEK